MSPTIKKNDMMFEIHLVKINSLAVFVTNISKAFIIRSFVSIWYTQFDYNKSDQNKPFLLKVPQSVYPHVLHTFKCSTHNTRTHTCSVGECIKKGQNTSVPTDYRSGQRATSVVSWLFFVFSSCDIIVWGFVCVLATDKNFVPFILCALSILLHSKTVAVINERRKWSLVGNRVVKSEFILWKIVGIFLLNEFK